MNRDQVSARITALRASARRRRHAASNPAVDPRSLLTAKQLEDYDHPASVLCSLWPRRTGKSYVKAAKLRRAAMQHRGTQNPYIALTANNARRFFLPPLLEVERLCGDVGRFNHSTLTMHYPNGSTIFLGGCETQRDRERYRGGSFGRAVLDECGAVFDQMTTEEADEFIGEILLPATLDVGGGLDLTGTPGRIWKGKWYDLTGPERKAEGPPLIVATMANNTAVDGLWERALALKTTMGWDDDHPTWVREYLGRWARDESILVFPWVRESNEVDRLPFPRTDPGWRWVLGVDVGQVDANAYVVWGAHRNDPNEYACEAKKVRGQLIGDMADDLRDYRQRYPGCRIVIDTGGMGKQHAVELTRLHRIQVEAADKQEKLSALTVVQDRIRQAGSEAREGRQHPGGIKTLATGCSALTDEWLSLRWNKDRTELAKDQEDHAAHAAMYGHRALRHYLYTPPEDRPVHGSPEWCAAEEAKMRDAIVKRGKRRRGKERLI